MEKPQRMCVICRSSTDKDKLFRFTETEGAYVYDEKQISQSRGIYVCQSLSCIERLSKHKKYKTSMKDLAEVAARAKKEGAKLINSLKMMNFPRKTRNISDTVKFQITQNIEKYFAKIALL